MQSSHHEESTPPSSTCSASGSVANSAAHDTPVPARSDDESSLDFGKKDAGGVAADGAESRDELGSPRLKLPDRDDTLYSLPKSRKTSQPSPSLRPFEGSGVTSPAAGANGNTSRGRNQLEMNQMHKLLLYETSTRFYLVGSNMMENHFRVLKIDRTAPPGQLSISEDEMAYDKSEKDDLLSTIEDGNKATGGLKLTYSAWGLLGFIRFTDAYYMLVITKRQQVAMIGGHYIYQIEATELVPLTTGSSSKFARDRNPEEVRYLAILNNLDLSRSFYFSQSYNVTRTLQHNIIRERESLAQGKPYHRQYDLNDMFVWNHYLLDPALQGFKNPYDWCLPVIHGFVDQASLDIYGRRVYITIVARRSRFFAGARFLKRGANDLGYVANDVETEQIVSEMVTTSFHAPGRRLYANPNYTAYVQHRGSIPLYWTQDNTGVTPKPDIDLNLIDPFYSAAALHFDNLFKRYGSPICVLNLIKSRERTPRESKLLVEFVNAINYLNQFLPEEHKIMYKAFDMSRASKTRGQDVMGILEEMSDDILKATGFFHNGDNEREEPVVQNGVCRTNCIDCLDRTNAAQFVIGKRALALQLQALGIISDEHVEYDTDAVDLFTHMFHDHGDAIAVQYGGSHLVNTVETYRNINHWQSNSRDMVESFKRYYNNSFLDAHRQEAYNLFLGNYVFTQGQPMLWDLATDYYLHHADPRMWSQKQQRSYINWYTPAFLIRRTLPPQIDIEADRPDDIIARIDNYWAEYYKPLAISTFLKTFAYRMNSNLKYLPPLSANPTRYDLSPFRVRKVSRDHDSPDKKPVRKGVTILEPHTEIDGEQSQAEKGPSSLEEWLNQQVNGNGPVMTHDILQKPHFELASSFPELSVSTNFKPADKNLKNQWTLKQFYDNSLNPSVTDAEATEYARYMEHPQHLPLVVSNEEPDADAYLNFLDYTSIGKGEKELEVSEDDVADLWDFLTVADDPLTVHEDDGERKRYKAYGKWLRGKSFFKQSKLDLEYKT